MTHYTVGMDRRTFLSTMGVAVFTTPLVAQAQPAVSPSDRLWRVGILFQIQAQRENHPYLEAIVQGFRDPGYVEGQNLKIEVRAAGGSRVCPICPRD